MKILLATAAVFAGGSLGACESDGGHYDGVSRFARMSDPYYGPGSPPREPAEQVPDTSGPKENI